MKTSVTVYALLFHLCFIGSAYAGANVLAKLEAVKKYLFESHVDYPEMFGDTPFRLEVNKVIVADVDDDGEEEVVLHVLPHFLQSPTIIIFKVSKDFKVTRVIEGLAPGPLVALTGNFMDSHAMGNAADFVIRDEHAHSEKRKEIVRLALGKMGGVVEYPNFIHMDGRKGKGTYVDMTDLKKPPTQDTCNNFEFSRPDEVFVQRKEGKGNYLFARLGKTLYSYKINKIGDDGFLDKTLTVIPAK